MPSINAVRAAVKAVTGAADLDDQKKAAANVVTYCFEARDKAHLLHLAANNFPTHEVLDDFYKSIIEPVDAFIEAFQGDNNVRLRTEYDIANLGRACPAEMDMTKPVASSTALLMWLRDSLMQQCRPSLSAEMQSLLDNVLEVVNQSIYKARMLLEDD